MISKFSGSLVWNMAPRKFKNHGSIDDFVNC